MVVVGARGNSTLRKLGGEKTTDTKQTNRARECVLVGAKGVSTDR